MTWFGQEEKTQSFGTSTKARQRWDQIKRDSRQVLERGETYVLVLWPMSGWQVWRRVDKVWLELEAGCESLQDAIRLADEMSKE